MSRGLQLGELGDLRKGVHQTPDFSVISYYRFGAPQFGKNKRPSIRTEADFTVEDRLLYAQECPDADGSMRKWNRPGPEIWDCLDIGAAMGVHRSRACWDS